MTVSFRANGQVRAAETVAYLPPGSDQGARRTTHGGTAEPHQVTPPEAVAYHWSYVEALPADTTVVVLDIDSTDDETHGQQQLTFFHGHYDHHMYHPLLIFDGDGQLVTALLRPGNAHAARSAWPMLRRVIRRIKARFPSALDGRVIAELCKYEAEEGVLTIHAGLPAPILAWPADAEPSAPLLVEHLAALAPGKYLVGWIERKLT